MDIWSCIFCDLKFQHFSPLVLPNSIFKIELIAVYFYFQSSQNSGLSQFFLNLRNIFNSIWITSQNFIATKIFHPFPFYSHSSSLFSHLSFIYTFTTYNIPPKSKFFKYFFLPRYTKNQPINLNRNRISK